MFSKVILLHQFTLQPLACKSCLYPCQHLTLLDFFFIFATLMGVNKIPFVLICISWLWKKLSLFSKVYGLLNISVRSASSSPLHHSFIYPLESYELLLCAKYCVGKRIQDEYAVMELLAYYYYTAFRDHTNYQNKKKKQALFLHLYDYHFAKQKYIL